MIKNLKKAAMFGLDARIALAIFGALSVISGAALYSAIQSAKATQAAVTFDNVEKAITQYMLDTGSNLAEYQTTDVTMYAGDLFKEPSGVTNWQGPYIGTNSSSRMFLELPITGNSSIDGTWRIRRYGADDRNTGITGTDPCSAGDCVMYIFSAASTTTPETYAALKALADSLENTIDGNDGDGQGRVRRLVAGTTISFFYKLNMPEFRYLARNP
tara:strand:+ start:2507 stop:3151 length:645 start_codon:yes stop_codon:yes gene_type:complete